MRRIYTNGGSNDFVGISFDRLAKGAAKMHLAAPYFTDAKATVDAAKAGCKIQLLIGLNAVTKPEALRRVMAEPNISVRYFTHRFHAKIYLFDDKALMGSANLTDGGFIANREAVIFLHGMDDQEAIEGIRSLFAELWEFGKPLTDSDWRAYAATWEANRPKGPDLDQLIEDAVGRAEPPNIDINSRKKSKERIFLDGLQRQIYEEFLPAFTEVGHTLEANDFLRPELAEIGLAHQTNRFLNWLRQTHVIGDDAWRHAETKLEADRQVLLIHYGKEWRSTLNNKVPPDYLQWIAQVRDAFGSEQSILSSTKDKLMDGLLSLHAFHERQRFVTGGLKNLPAHFWKENSDNLKRVQTTLAYLLHGPGDFAPRLHDVIYDPKFRLNGFKYFCALELFGTVHPEICPPITGRMAKALKFLGFDVKAT